MAHSDTALVPRVLTLGESIVDLEQRTVRRRGECVPITLLEADLLRHLAERRGHCVERELLLSVVWGYSPRVVSRAVDHTVWRLRRKIEEDPSAPRWITSVRSGGYRLEPEPPALPQTCAVSSSLRRMADLIDAADLLAARAVAPAALAELAATLWAAG